MNCLRVGADELALEALSAGDLGCGAECHATADEALEVRRLAQRPPDSRRGDVDRVLPAIVVELARDPLAESVVDALRMVDVDTEAIGSKQLNGEHFRARH